MTEKIEFDRRHRHRGIARALLRTPFVRSHERGYICTRPSTDSRTGALSLYVRIGMIVDRSLTWHGLDP